MLRDAESARQRDYGTEEAMLQRAREALLRFATDSTAGYSNARFLRLHTTATLGELRTRTDAMVDSLLTFLGEIGSKHACAGSWSPERLAATACFYHTCVDGAQGTGSRWRAHVAGRPNYTPGDRIEDLGVLAVHVPRDCGADTPAAPRDQEECPPLRRTPDALAKGRARPWRRPWSSASYATKASVRTRRSTGTPTCITAAAASIASASRT